MICKSLSTNFQEMPERKQSRLPPPPENTRAVHICMNLTVYMRSVQGQFQEQTCVRTSSCQAVCMPVSFSARSRFFSSLPPLRSCHVLRNCMADKSSIDAQRYRETQAVTGILACTPHQADGHTHVKEDHFRISSCRLPALMRQALHSFQS